MTPQINKICFLNYYREYIDPWENVSYYLITPILISSYTKNTFKVDYIRIISPFKMGWDFSTSIVYCPGFDYLFRKYGLVK